MAKRTCRPAEERFWGKVKSAEADECWIWTASVGGSGYGQFGIETGKPNALAHRWAYEHLIGPIPDGLEIDHLCRVRRCVNPWHMDPVTARVNWLRSSNPSAVAKRREACAKGHPYTSANTYFPSAGWRQCRVCKNQRQREYSARKTARARAAREPEDR